MKVKRAIYSLATIILLALIVIALPQKMNARAIEEINQTEITLNNSLFDIFVDIPADYRTLAPGGELLVSVKLINIGSKGRIDVFLDYDIDDPKGETIVDKVETVAVETQANFVRTFDIPKDAKPGNYKLEVKLIYADGKMAVAEQSFKIVNKTEDKTMVYVGFSVIMIGGAALLLFLIKKSRPVIENIKLKNTIHTIVKEKLKE